MKTLVRIFAGHNTGDVGWINGTLPLPETERTAVFVHFPLKSFPHDLKRIDVSRLYIISEHEALLCGVSVPSSTNVKDI